MGIALIIIFVILFAASFVGMKQGWLRTATWLISIIGLVASLATITLGDSQHFGMKKETVTSIKQIDPAFAIKNMNINVAIKSPVGTKDESVVVYKNQGAKKTTHTQADAKTVNKFARTREQSAQLLTTTKRYTYKNNFFKLFYAGLGTNHQYISRVNKFQITNDWIVLTPKQVKKMQNQMKSQQANSKAQLQAVIKKQVVAARMQNPNMTAAQQAALVKKIQTAAVAKASAAAKTKLKAMSIE